MNQTVVTFTGPYFRFSHFDLIPFSYIYVAAQEAQ